MVANNVIKCANCGGVLGAPASPAQCRFCGATLAPPKTSAKNRPSVTASVTTTSAKSRPSVAAWIWIAGFVVLGVGVPLFLLLRSGGLVKDVPIDIVNAPRLSTTTTAKFSWWSVPITSAEGKVYGLVRSETATNQLVAISESTGELAWRVAIPRESSLATYARSVGWARPPSERNVQERAPVAPFGAQNGAAFVLAFDREWLVADAVNGTIRGRGKLPTGIPAFDSLRGACAQDATFWIGVNDGRDGGVRVSENGTLNAQREERPQDCRAPVLFRAEYGFRWAPGAGLRNTDAPPGDCMRKRKNASRAENTCATFLGETPSGTRLGMAYEEVHLDDGQRARSFRLAGMRNEYPSAYGVEAGKDGVLFFTLALYRSTSTVHEPPKSSFQPAVTTTSAGYIEAVVAVSPEGRPLWTTSPGTSPYLYDTALLIASHPRSRDAILYLYKPGSLAALDQKTGAMRFRLASE